MYAHDKLLYNQLVDFLAGKPDFYINYKEFINWFFLEKIFLILKKLIMKKTLTTVLKLKTNTSILRDPLLRMSVTSLLTHVFFNVN